MKRLFSGGIYIFDFIDILDSELTF